MSISKGRADISFRRLKNRLIAKLITRFPSLTGLATSAYAPWESEDVPWAPVKKALHEMTLAMVTTAGIHHTDQEPFDMKDSDGDPSYRVLDIRRPLDTLMITHDYYDHTDADRDINIIFPIERLRELVEDKRLGGLSDKHYAFMGHIDGPHIHTLIERTAPEVARALVRDGVDAVLLTPG